MAIVGPLAQYSLAPAVLRILDEEDSRVAARHTAQVKPLVTPPSAPAFRQLRQGENIRIPPPNWLERRLPDGTIVDASVYHGLPDLPHLDVCSLMRAPHVSVEDVDFIGTTDGVKSLFRLPYSSSELSMIVHRLGRTIVLDSDPMAGRLAARFGLTDDAPSERVGALSMPFEDGDVHSAAVRNQIEVNRRELTSKFIYRTALPDHDAATAAVRPAVLQEGHESAGVAASSTSRLAHDVASASSRLAGAAPAANSGVTRGSSLFLDEDGTAHTHTEPTLCSHVPFIPPPPADAARGEGGSGTSLEAAAAAASGAGGAGGAGGASGAGEPGGDGRSGGDAEPRSPDRPHLASPPMSPTARVAPSRGARRRIDPPQMPSQLLPSQPEASSPSSLPPPPLDSAAIAAAVEPAGVHIRDVGDDVLPQRAAAEASRHGPLPHFRRVCRWRFNDYKMVLGSNLLAFGTSEKAAVALRLQDIEERLTQHECLDMYLDNTMAGVPETAICYHDKGVVQSYQVVPTDEMAALGHEPFSPFVVEQNAATLLKFLKDNCNQNFGSYWLYRKQGEAVVQLFDLSTFPIDQKCRSKWTYMMAMLCYRYASQLRTSRHRVRANSDSSLYDDAPAESQRGGGSGGSGKVDGEQWRVQLLQKCAELLSLEAEEEEDGRDGRDGCGVDFAFARRGGGGDRTAAGQLSDAAADTRGRDALRGDMHGSMLLESATAVDSDANRHRRSPGRGRVGGSPSRDGRSRRNCAMQAQVYEDLADISLSHALAMQQEPAGAVSAPGVASSLSPASSTATAVTAAGTAATPSATGAAASASVVPPPAAARGRARSRGAERPPAPPPGAATPQLAAPPVDVAASTAERQSEAAPPALAYFNDAARYLMMALDRVQLLAEEDDGVAASDDDVGDDPNGVDGGAADPDGAGPFGSDLYGGKLWALLKRVVSVGVGCARQCLELSTPLLGVRILDDVFQLWRRTCDARVRVQCGDVWSALPADVTTDVLEVFGCLAAALAHSTAAAAASTPRDATAPVADAPSAATPPSVCAEDATLPPIPFPCLQDALASVLASAPPPLAIGGVGDAKPAVGTTGSASAARGLSGAAAVGIPPDAVQHWGRRLAALGVDTVSVSLLLPVLSLASAVSLPRMQSSAVTPSPSSSLSPPPSPSAPSLSPSAPALPTASVPQQSIAAQDWMTYAAVALWHSVARRSAADSVADDASAFRGVVAKVLGEALNSLGQRCSAQRRFMAALPFYSAAFWAMQDALHCLVLCNMSHALLSDAHIGSVADAHHSRVADFLLASCAEAATPLHAAALVSLPTVPSRRLLSLEVAEELCHFAARLCGVASVAPKKRAVGSGGSGCGGGGGSGSGSGHGAVDGSATGTVQTGVIKALAAAQMSVGINLSNMYQAALQAGAVVPESDAFLLVCKRISACLYAALQLYADVHNDVQSAAASFQLASFHAAHLNNPVYCRSAASMEVVLIAAAENFDTAASKYGDIARCGDGRSVDAVKTLLLSARSCADAYYRAAAAAAAAEWRDDAGTWLRSAVSRIVSASQALAPAGAGDVEARLGARVFADDTAECAALLRKCLLLLLKSYADPKSAAAAAVRRAYAASLPAPASCDVAAFTEWCNGVARALQ